MEIASIPADSYTLGFIGAGKMAESIARGAVRSGVLPPSRIRTAVHSNPARRTAFESFGVTVLSSNDDVLGAASMVTQTGKHPGQLKDDVTSPGGTTITGIHELENGGFRGTLMNAVVAAAKRSRELS
ncbi:hypothetical protein V8G54_020044 [Vigna mungo]|uniref:Pyrroline-5-carboxylate reductase dimerisation domain-containing protein n=1 Tax=Vigna mungo TaxID=3915 RepID=A0AAQ3NES8_VIGMU